VIRFVGEGKNDMTKYQLRLHFWSKVHAYGSKYMLLWQLKGSGGAAGVVVLAAHG
jgi:hypothetical protein